MKLLLFSDVHVSKSHCLKLCERSEQVDIVVGAGDFGALRRGINRTISWLSAISKPTVVVPGNAESYQELKQACDIWHSARVLHGTGVEIKGLMFFGIGGGIPVTPFGSWSYDFSEAQARELLTGCPPDAILVTHSPPLGLLDVSSSGVNLGSSAILEAVRAKHPVLVVCGHIHESSGKTLESEGTVVINAGPDGIIFDLKVKD